MKNIIILLGTAVLLGACSTIQFTSDKDGSADFTKFKTMSYYGWQEDSDKILSRFERERIEKAFGDEFRKRGMTLVERDGDAIVSLYVVVDQKTGVTAYSNHYGAGGPYGYYGGYGYGAGWGWGMGYSSTSYQEYDYQVGTLVCDVFDSKTKKLVWQGVVSGELDDSPKTRERNIPRVVTELMKRYPVPVTKKK